MSAFVRVRKLEDLRQKIDMFGRQTELAAASGVSIQRVNQLYSGRHGSISVDKAAQLEDCLNVPRGSLFAAVNPALLAPYVMAHGPHDTEPPAMDAQPGSRPDGEDEHSDERHDERRDDDSSPDSTRGGPEDAPEPYSAATAA